MVLTSLLGINKSYSIAATISFLPKPAITSFPASRTDTHTATDTDRLGDRSGQGHIRLESKIRTEREIRLESKIRTDQQIRLESKIRTERQNIRDQDKDRTTYKIREQDNDRETYKI